MRIPAVIIALCLFLAGCECQVRTEIVEDIYAYGTSGVVDDIIKGFRRQGYNCPSESIRNGAGVSIGTKYTCTKCD